MLLDILFIVAGIIIVLWGADKLTDGSVAVAERLKVPEIIIGLTIVAFGTSMPEFMVSFLSALKGTPDLAVGNIVGSNIFNVLFIVGIAALTTPLTITPQLVKTDIPLAILVSIILALMCLDSHISRIDAAVLLVFFALFMYMTLRNAGDKNEDTGKKKNYTVLKMTLFIILGLAGLIIGSNVFVDGATGIAEELGVSDALIGLTIVAGGTSLPELATSVVAAKKGNSGISIGNIVGSNQFNILFILGFTGIISPMQMNGITMIDFAVMIFATALLWIFCRTKHRIERWEGLVFTLMFASYMAWLISNVV